MEKTADMSYFRGIDEFCQDMITMQREYAHDLSIYVLSPASIQSKQVNTDSTYTFTVKRHIIYVRILQRLESI